jgi:hypothetical protein
MTVLDWLLDSDPAIRWQVLRDVVHAPAEIVSAERARVAAEGWGARLLALQGDDGQWAGGACFPARSSNWREENQGQPWTATLPTLQLLHDFGVDPADDHVRRAVALVRDRCRWEHAGQPFFSGEVEPCINGRTVTLGIYFDQDVDAVVARLLAEQLDDGGWNCEAENGSVRSSFATTINVLEGLLAHERATGGSAKSIAARRRGEEYLLERQLFRRKSTGEVVNAAWLQCSFPTRWRYDVLRALDYFRSAGDAPDARTGDAIDILRSKQQTDGTWLLENTHPGKVHFALEDGDGRPTRCARCVSSVGTSSRRPEPPLVALRPETPCEAVQGCGFVVEDLEHDLQLQHRQQMVAPRGELRQLHDAALLPDHFRFRDHHADACAVDVGDTAEIGDDFHPSLFDEAVDVAAERQVAVIDRDLARQREHGHVALLALDDLKFRWRARGHAAAVECGRQSLVWQHAEVRHANLAVIRFHSAFYLAPFVFRLRFSAACPLRWAFEDSSTSARGRRNRRTTHAHV